MALIFLVQQNNTARVNGVVSLTAGKVPVGHGETENGDSNISFPPLELCRSVPMGPTFCREPRPAEMLQTLGGAFSPAAELVSAAGAGPCQPPALQG